MNVGNIGETSTLENRRKMLRADVLQVLIEQAGVIFTQGPFEQ